jgi:hypothetical protein
VGWAVWHRVSRRPCPICGHQIWCFALLSIVVSGGSRNMWTVCAVADFRACTLAAARAAEACWLEGLSQRQGKRKTASGDAHLPSVELGLHPETGSSRWLTVFLVGTSLCTDASALLHICKCRSYGCSRAVLLDLQLLLSRC